MRRDYGDALLNPSIELTADKLLKGLSKASPQLRNCQQLGRVVGLQAALGTSRQAGNHRPQLPRLAAQSIATTNVLSWSKAVAGRGASKDSVIGLLLSMRSATTGYQIPWPPA